MARKKAEREPGSPGSFLVAFIKQLQAAQDDGLEEYYVLAELIGIGLDDVGWYPDTEEAGDDGQDAMGGTPSDVDGTECLPLFESAPRSGGSDAGSADGRDPTTGLDSPVADVPRGTSPREVRGGALARAVGRMMTKAEIPLPRRVK